MKSLSWFFVLIALFVLPSLGLAQDSNSAAADFSAATSQAVAGPFAPMSARIVSDPLFIPLKGQIYGVTAYTFTYGTSNGYNYKVAETSHSKSDANAFAQTLEYGLTNELNIHVTDSYDFSNSDSTSDKTGYTSKADDRGFIDPTIGLTYRVLDQMNNSPVDVDLTANYAPDMFTDQIGSSGQEGTEASGRQVATFIAGIGREMRNFSAQVTGSVAYLGVDTYQALSTGDYYKQKDTWQFTPGLNTQTRLTDRFSINLGSNYTFANNRNTYNTTSGASFISVPAETWSSTAALNYQVIPDRLVAGLTYTYDKYSNSKSLYPLTTSDGETEKHSANVYGVRLQYLFG